jgi:hypothetical protein
MPKRAVSLTLDHDNLLWLKARALTEKRGSVSETLDAVIRDARAAGRVPAGSIRSVVGTIDISPEDPWLENAGAEISGLFEASLARPSMVREDPPGRPRTRRRG